MTEYIKEPVRSYIEEKLVLNSPPVEAIRDYGEEHQVPIIHRDVANAVSFLIRLHGVKSILEVGTAIGYSARVFLEAMNYEGTVTTIERSERMLERARDNLKDFNQITLLEGDALEILPTVEGTYDMLFLDGAKSKYQEMIGMCLKVLRPGGLIISDNVLFKGMTASDEFVIRRKKTIVRNMREYLDFLYEDPFETMLLPIGDGLAITRIKEDI